jgi:hypothetical protein
MGEDMEMKRCPTGWSCSRTPESPKEGHVSLISKGQRGSMGVGSAVEFDETNGDDIMSRCS